MKAPKSMRIWFVIMAVILWTGIYLSGFSRVSWLLYLPAAGFVFAAITGICPSWQLFKMFGDTIKETPGK